MTDGDVPGGTGAGSGAGGGGDEAVWLDLVARFDAPARADADPPWPDREDLAGPVHVTPAVPPGVPPTAPEAAPREPPTNPSGLPGLPLHGGPPTMPDEPRPDQPITGRAWPGLGGGSGPRDVAPADDPASEHYVPPVPPPLPRLDPATKLAWLALFGGPLYLLVATATSTPISGLAAFLAVAAFVGGFVVLVLRMDNGRPPDSGSDDDGAVV
ncbi:MAG TPA: hypothetical protein VMI73_27990 [Trebonia sp.]|nr:hypothetical protein [Trebonia sp.]